MHQPAVTAVLPVRLPRRLHPPALAGLVLLLCLGMTWQLWDGARQSREAAQRAAFDLRAREAAGQLSQRMAAYVQLLKGVQGLFASSQTVTRSEFADFVFSHDLDRQLPGVQAIGFMAAVPGSGRAAHEAQVRADGIDGYAVWPAGQRGVYAPMTYIEPFNAVNARVLGYDGWSDPVRRAMLAQARDSGLPTMSGPLRLLQEDQGRPLSGFVIALPVYRNGVPRLNTEQRRAALAGWVVAPFSAADVLAGLDRTYTDGLALELVEGGAGTAPARSGGQPRTSWHSVAVGPQSINLKVSAADREVAGDIGAVGPAAVGMFGLGVTLALTALTFLLARSSVAAGRALGQARTLARELENGRQEAVALADAAHHAQAMMRSILDSAIEGILVDDGNGRILASNERFREMWSVPPRLDMVGDDLGLLEHMVGLLAQPAAFLHGHSLPLRDAVEQTALLQLGDGRFFEQTLSPVRLGTCSARLWSYRDITQARQIAQRERAHRDVLELLGHGAPLARILDAVVLSVESPNPSMRCAIMLVEGDHLVTGAAPNLPEFFRQAIEGIRIGPDATACGAAAWLGTRVITEDIRSHPHWQAQREVAERAGLRSCWAEPIRGASGRILGSFAIYHCNPQYPSAANVMLIEQAAQLAGIALEQAKGVQAARAGQERYRCLYRNAPVALWELDFSGAREAWQTVLDAGVTDLAAWLRTHPGEAARMAQQVGIVDLNQAALAMVGGRREGLTLAQLFGAPCMSGFADVAAGLAGGASAFSLPSYQLTFMAMPGHEESLDLVIAATPDCPEALQPLRWRA